MSQGGEAAKEKGAGVMADPSGFGKKDGEAAKEKGAGIMADPSGESKGLAVPRTASASADAAPLPAARVPSLGYSGAI